MRRRRRKSRNRSSQRSAVSSKETKEFSFVLVPPQPLASGRRRARARSPGPAGHRHWPALSPIDALGKALLTLSRLLKNPPFTLRQAQGERREACNRWRFSVRAEPVEARIRLFQQPAKLFSTGVCSL